MTLAPFTRFTFDRRMLVYAAGSLVAIVVLALIALGPLRGQFRALDEKIGEAEKKMARNLRVLSPAAKDVVVRDFRLYGETLRKKGTTAEESAALLAEVEMLAAQSKIALSSTKPSEPRIDSDCESYAVTVEFEGDMAQVVGFLYAVETSPNMLRADRFSLDAKGARAQGTLKCALVVSRLVTL